MTPDFDEAIPQDTEHSKIERLNMLFEYLKDSIAGFSENTTELSNDAKIKVLHEHPILYEGNPDAKILVVQFSPDNSESYFAQTLKTHNYVCRGPSGNFIRDHLRNAGFNVEKDIVYCNLIPFVPLGYHVYEEYEVIQYLWVYEELYDIIQPEIVVSLGFNATQYISDISTVPKRYIDPMDRSGDIFEPPRAVFETILKREHTIIQTDNHLFVPLNDPDVVMSEQHNKNKSFFNTIKQLYPCYKNKTRKKAA